MSKLTPFWLLCLATCPAHSEIISPVEIVSSTSGDFFPVGNLISGLGLTGPDPQEHYYDDFDFPPSRRDLWVTETVGEGANYNYFDFRSAPTLTLDLGTDYVLDAVYLWAYASGRFVPDSYQANTVRDFELTFNTEAEGEVFADLAEFSSAMEHGRVLPTGRPSLSDTEPRQDFLLPNPAPRNPTYVKCIETLSDRVEAGRLSASGCGATQTK
jgi:hypothetical protein